MLSSSDRGGIRIQFSKNPYGKKRDAIGNYISTLPGQAGVDGYGVPAAAAYEPTAVPPTEALQTGNSCCQLSSCSRFLLWRLI